MDSRILSERMRHGSKRRSPLSQEVKKALTALMITLSLLFITASVMFLYSTGKSAQQGFLLRQTEIENEKERSENRDLKQKVLQAQSFKNILDGKTTKNMEQSSKPLYVPPDKVTLRTE